MGKHAWTPAEARKALDAEGIPVADATIQAQLSAGRTGQRGEPAKLTDSQAQQLHGHRSAQGKLASGI
jgi:hypothetical protein